MGADAKSDIIMLPNSDCGYLGADWLHDRIDQMSHEIIRRRPVEFNEEFRYLPDGTTRRPGYIRYDLFPFLREIIDCFDPLSPVRECNLMKGVQVGYTTLLESVLLYYIGHIKTQPGMFLTAEKELATGRMENNIIPMINASGFDDLIRSADLGNARKTGKTKDFLQWDGGGSLIYNGANNAVKMRQYSVPWMLKDELDGWKEIVGKDGNPDGLTDDRLSTYWSIRKILRGSTPLLVPSMIHAAYLKGDQRIYIILCRSCSFPQIIKFDHREKDGTGEGGFRWEFDSDGTLSLDSVNYRCKDCGHPHYEKDKEYIFAEENGAHWKPTAKPKEPGIRSYHLPAFYSPFDFQPWSKNVAQYLDAYDTGAKCVKNYGLYQKFYNNVLGMPYEIIGSRIRYESVDSHRRTGYRYGQVPNKYALKYSGSKILFLTCLVDVHKRFLAVAVMGWTKHAKSYLIDYWKFEYDGTVTDECTETTSKVWGRLRTLIEEKVYTADDGTKYKIFLTLIDANFAKDTITSFCSDYATNVYPILGVPSPAKNQRIEEFAKFTTKIGTTGYRILVDHYKDRLAPVMRREWVEGEELQPRYHWNAPTDITRKQLNELCAETKEKNKDAYGSVSYVWYRRGANELWDLSVYGHASVEIIAWEICIEHFKLETVDWDTFWEYVDENGEFFRAV
jgi:phage terminase large subunit GpA-like protein